MRMWVAVVTLVALAAVSGAAWATDYYVATTGSDTDPGTGALPWATLQHAVDWVGPGDTILVRSGTYVGCRIESSGAPGSPCTLKADTGAAVLVNSASASSWHDSNIEVEGAHYWVIDGIESAGSARYGIDVRVAYYVTVRNCVVHDAAVTGIFTGFTDYVTIDNNESYANGEHGIYHSNSADYPAIRRNRSHDNYGCGIHMNGDASMGGDGLITSAVVERNVIWGNGTGGGSAINCDGVSDSIIRNNLAYSNHAGGIALYAIDASEGSSRDLVYNNTIIQPSDGRWAVNIPSSTDGQDNPTGNSIVNNILYNYHPWRGVITVWDPGALATSDYNILMDRFSIDDDTTTITFAEWTAYGFDAHSSLAAPADLFVDPAGFDFHLKAGSPAIDAGTNLPEVWEDCEGASRPQGASTDIGCYEGASGPASPVACFSASPRGGRKPLAVTFTDLSSGAPTSWEWDFGDGATSTAQNPTHDYSLPGSYAVALTVANDYGTDSESETGYIRVGTFADVLPGYWAWSQVEACAAADIVGGYSDGYHPEEAVTRAQMAVYISRALAGGDAGVPTGPAIATFTDVPVNHWAFRYVEYAYARHIVGGYWNGYLPRRVVDRGQMAVFVARAIVDPTGDEGLIGYTPPSTPTFPDVPAYHWSYRWIEYLYAQGIVGGYGDGYHPEETVNRAQMAVFVQRAFGLPM